MSLLEAVSNLRDRPARKWPSGEWDEVARHGGVDRAVGPGRRALAPGRYARTRHTAAAAKSVPTTPHSNH
jgi:hypothetical protein